MGIEEIEEIFNKKVVDHLKEKAAAEIKKGIRKWQLEYYQIAEKRCLFELLQNTIDTARKNNGSAKVEISLSNDKKHLIFKHNAGAFSVEDLIAIIYGGTTKTQLFAPSRKYIGRFGSGFLVTHILSRIVKINGILKENGENYSFEIRIDRTSDSEQDIINGINSCFDQLKAAKTKDLNDDDCWSEFEYELMDDKAVEHAEVGIKTLEKLLPFILALNSEKVEITINGITYSKEKNDLDKDPSNVVIKSNGRKISELLISTDKDIAVCTVLNNNEISVLESIPRLFVSMPLIGSEKIPIPFVIGSLLLEPNEDRDSVQIAITSEEVEREEVECNKELLKKAFNCYYKIVSYCIQEDYKNLFRLFSFSKIPEDYYSQKEEYWKFWAENIKNTVAELQELNIIKTEDGYKKPADVIFPLPIISVNINQVTLTDDQFNKFYFILNEIKKILPIKETTYYWQQISLYWKEIDSNINLNFYSIESLRDEIKAASIENNHFQSIEHVAEKLKIQSDDLKDILISLFRLIDELYTENKEKINPDFVNGLLLAQSGRILTKSFTISDVNNTKLPNSTLGIEKEKIPEEIKDISRGIAYDMYSILLDNDFSQFIIIKDLLDKEITIDNIIEEILKYKLAAGHKVEFKHLFYWDEIPEKNNELIKFLESELNAEWLKKTKIEKINDGRTITISEGDSLYSLNLNEEKTNVVLKTDDNDNRFIAKMENGKLNIYDFKNKRDKGWAKLFLWCSINDKIKDKFPVYTRDNIVKHVDFGILEPFLFLPFEEMGIDNEYEEVIPKNRILNPEYFNLINYPEKENFKNKVCDNKICFDNPIQKLQKLKIKKTKLMKILVGADLKLKVKEHEITADKDFIFTIPFWYEISGRINQVPELAKKYVYFLLNVICERDDSWKSTLQVDCSCGEKHEVIPSEWLANIKDDSWIPIQEGDEEGHFVQREVTRENIVKLLSPEEVDDIIKSDIGIELFSHFGFDKLDLKIKRKSIASNMSETVIRDELVQVVEREDIIDLVQYSEKDIEKIKLQIQENKENERIANENHKTGKLVEEIIIEILNDKGIKEINRIDAGADIEIWPEGIEGVDCGKLGINPYLIEIKFTTGDRARFSKRQAKEADETRENYFILVVTGNVYLKQKLLFDYDKYTLEEKSEIKDLIEESSYMIEGISGKLIKAPNPEEVEPDINGYWIKDILWLQGEKLNDWISTVM